MEGSIHPSIQHSSTCSESATLPGAGTLQDRPTARRAEAGNSQENTRHKQALQRKEVCGRGRFHWGRDTWAETWKREGSSLRRAGRGLEGSCCCCWVTSAVSNSLWPHRWQPTRLRRPWDSPGKNTGVGCHFLLQWRKVKSEGEVSQSCPTLRDPMDCGPPGSYVHGIFQARGLEWGAIAFSAWRLREQQFLGGWNECGLWKGWTESPWDWGMKLGREAMRWGQKVWWAGSCQVGKPGLGILFYMMEEFRIPKFQPGKRVLGSIVDICHWLASIQKLFSFWGITKLMLGRILAPRLIEAKDKKNVFSLLSRGKQNKAKPCSSLGLWIMRSFLKDARSVRNHLGDSATVRRAWDERLGAAESSMWWPRSTGAWMPVKCPDWRTGVSVQSCLAEGL